MTVAVPFNHAEAMERRIERLFEEGRPPACVIMEPALMNLGVVLPEPGYLEAVREITRKHGVLLIFDEVKTGLCIAAGGGTERFGVTPDLVTLAKALGGGLPSGAIGGTERGLRAGRGGEGGAGRHLQRQPAVDGGGAREPAGGADARCVRAPRRAQRPHPLGLPGGDRRSTRSPATRSGSDRRGASRSHPSGSSTTRRSRRTRTRSCASSRGSTT